MQFLTGQRVVVTDCCIGDVREVRANVCGLLDAMIPQSRAHLSGWHDSLAVQSCRRLHGASTALRTWISGLIWCMACDCNRSPVMVFALRLLLYSIGEYAESSFVESGWFDTNRFGSRVYQYKTALQRYVHIPSAIEDRARACSDSSITGMQCSVAPKNRVRIPWSWVAFPADHLSSEPGWCSPCSSCP